MGKHPNIVVKTAAILSSLLLVGGCVSYRAGVFDAIPEPRAIQNTQPESQPKPPLSPAKVGADPAPADPAGSDAKKSDAVIFSGTKAPIGNSIFVPSIVPK